MSALHASFGWGTKPVRSLEGGARTFVVFGRYVALLSEVRYERRCSNERLPSATMGLILRLQRRAALAGRGSAEAVRNMYPLNCCGFE
jgi:hypothetical protein